METYVRVNNPEDAADRAEPVKESSHCSRLDWVDPKVIEIIFVYRDSSSIDSFMDNHNLLKPDGADNILAIDYCRPINTICMGQASSNGPFFFVYSCLFSDLHVALTFDDLTMGALRALNVAPSQLHPNTWASLQAFRHMCDMLHHRPTSSTFLHYYTSHPTEPFSWLSLISRWGNILFAPFTSTYKNFKGKFFKIFIEPKGREIFFYELRRSKFLLYWTKASAEDWEVYALFDSLPRKLPT